MANIKEEDDVEKKETQLFSRSITTHSIADKQVLKKFENVSDDLSNERVLKKFEKNSDKGKTRVSEKSRMSKKKGIFSFLFKKSKSMSDLKNDQLDEDKNNK